MRAEHENVNCSAENHVKSRDACWIWNWHKIVMHAEHENVYRSTQNHNDELIGM